VAFTSAVTIERARYKGWDSWSLRRGLLELVLVPQVGGRVMGMNWRDRELAFTHPEREGLVESVASASDVRARKRELGFPLWGGDKTWLAPQTRWTDGVPFLDLDSGPYELSFDRSTPDRAKATMTSAVCRETGVRVERTVVLPAFAEGWSVIHRITNASGEDVEWAIWDVSMVRQPGRVYLPTDPSSQHPKGVKTFASEGESSQLRDAVVNHLGDIAVVECRRPHAYKFGVDSDEGWILGLLDVEGVGLVGYRKEVPTWAATPYGHGCVAEVYNSDRYPYLEMEIHGPMVRLKPGESFQIEESQAVFEVPRWPTSEAEVRSLVRR
jgi:hypothetical protein